MRPMYGVAQHVPFTYGMWTAALTGIYGFVLAYPGLFFLYQVFLDDEWTCVAIGRLDLRLDPAVSLLGREKRALDANTPVA